MFELLWSTRGGIQWAKQKVVKSVTVYKHEEDEHEVPEASDNCLTWELADYSDTFRAEGAARSGGATLGNLQHGGPGAAHAAPA